MLDIDQIINEVLKEGAKLAANAGEDFVLAVTAAYAVGMEAGKRAAQGAA